MTQVSLIRVDREQTKEDGLTLWPIYSIDGVEDIGMGMSLGVGSGAKKLADRLEKAYKAGAAFPITGVNTRVDGSKFVTTKFNVLGRTLNADLKRLGF